MNLPPVIRLASERPEPWDINENPCPRIFTPGEIVEKRTDFIRGHGTYLGGDAIRASVAGIAHQISKLLLVRPTKNRYTGEMGDVVVGRISEVLQKRWKLDVNARLDALLLLSSVNFATGELRRKLDDDEATMRQFMQEGDLICAEVQQIFSDGGLLLHTRSMKYGKLAQGTLVKVTPSLIKRHKTHFHNFPWGTSVILGNNGYVFIYPTSHTPDREKEEKEIKGKTEKGKDKNKKETLKRATQKEREDVGRVRSCIIALANAKMMLYDTPLIFSYDLSHRYTMEDLIKPEIMIEIAYLTQLQIEEKMGR